MKPKPRYCHDCGAKIGAAVHLCDKCRQAHLEVRQRPRTCEDCGCPLTKPRVRLCPVCRQRRLEDRQTNADKTKGKVYLKARSYATVDSSTEKIRGRFAVLRRIRVDRYAQYAQAGLPIPFEERFA